MIVFNLGGIGTVQACHQAGASTLVAMMRGFACTNRHMKPIATEVVVKGHN